MGQISDRLKRQRGGKVESGRHEDKGFRERLDAAADAKKALLDKFRAQAGSEDPAVAERQAARDAALKVEQKVAPDAAGKKKP